MNELLRKLFAPGIASEQWNLNKWDYIKAFIVGIFAPCIMMLIQAVTAWTSSASAHFIFDWTLFAKTGVSCFVGYLAKNYLTPSSNPPLK